MRFNFALPSENFRVRMIAAARSWYCVVGAVWLIRYATLDFIPPWHDPIWTTWFDQSRYLASATALARGNLTASAHWYALGYPLFGSPFSLLLPGNPFFLADLLLFLVTCHAFQRVSGALGIRLWPATWCFLATTLIQTGLASAWAIPWTTTLSAALIWSLIARTVVLSDGSDPDGRGAFLWTGAMLAALPLTRPSDALLSATFFVIIFAIVVCRRRFFLGALGGIAVGAALIGAAYAALHLAIYGPHPTAYMIAAAKTGFVLSDLGWKAYVLLIDPRPWFPGGRSILHSLPWIVPGCVGLIAACVAGNCRVKLVVGLLLVVIVPTSVMMLTYADLQPPGLWEFGNIHYFKWTMPAFGLGILLCWKLLHTPSGRRALGVTLPLVMLPLGIRITPVPVTERMPARMLLFKGSNTRDYNEAYFSPVEITDDVGVMRNVNDFHQIPDEGGEREIAVRRLFASNPRRSDPGEPQFRTRQSPYARFGEQLSYLGVR